MRNRWWMRFVLTPVAALFAVLGWYAIGALLLGHSNGMSVGTRVLVLLIVVLPTVTATVAMLIGPALKETFTPTTIRARGIGRTHTIELATASRIRQVRAAVHTGRGTVPVGRLQITGDRTHKIPMNAILDPTLTHFDAAMAILDEWVRQRPELVADDVAARDVFVGRGVLSPTTGRRTDSDL